MGEIENRSLQQDMPEPIRVMLYHLTCEALDRACEICDMHSVGTCTDIRAWGPALDVALKIFGLMSDLGVIALGPQPVNVPEKDRSSLIQQFVNRNNLKSLIYSKILQDKGTHRGYDPYFATILKMIGTLLHEASVAC